MPDWLFGLDRTAALVSCRRASSDAPICSSCDRPVRRRFFFGLRGGIADKPRPPDAKNPSQDGQLRSGEEGEERKELRTALPDYAPFLPRQLWGMCLTLHGPSRITHDGRREANFPSIGLSVASSLQPNVSNLHTPPQRAHAASTIRIQVTLSIIWRRLFRCLRPSRY
jgi:hypothetical protein